MYHVPGYCLEAKQTEILFFFREDDWNSLHYALTMYLCKLVSINTMGLISSEAALPIS